MKLIVNGDDFGITHACNLAIIDCFNNGVLTSTSMMVNMPYAKEASELWKQNPKLSVGLHLNITLGYPVNKNTKKIIKEDGTFNKAVLTYLSEQVDLQEIAEECQAQMDKFIQLTGKKPDHINSHHGIECIDGCSKIVQELANHYKLPLRQFSNTNEADISSTHVYRQRPARRMLTIPSENIEDTLNLFTEVDVKSDHYYELIGHPGYVDFELTQISSLTTGRCIDTKCFCCDEIKTWVKTNNIELINYTNLP